MELYCSVYKPRTHTTKWHVRSDKLQIRAAQSKLILVPFDFLSSWAMYCNRGLLLPSWLFTRRSRMYGFKVPVTRNCLFKGLWRFHNIEQLSGIETNDRLTLVFVKLDWCADHCESLVGGIYSSGSMISLDSLTCDLTICSSCIVLLASIRNTPPLQPLGLPIVPTSGEHIAIGCLFPVTGGLPSSTGRFKVVGHTWTWCARVPSLHKLPTLTAAIRGGRDESSKKSTLPGPNASILKPNSMVAARPFKKPRRSWKRGSLQQQTKESITSDHRIWIASGSRPVSFTSNALESKSADLLSLCSFSQQQSICWKRACRPVTSCLIGSS